MTEIRKAVNIVGDITGLILAGGKARRMGGQDKGLVEFRQRPLITQVIERLKPQVGRIIINSNRNRSAYEAFGYTVVTDATGDFAGPLAGLLAGMGECNTPYVALVPCDSPFIPADLISRLIAGFKPTSEISVAVTSGRMQPVFAVLQTRLLESLQNYLDTGERKIDTWYAQHATVEVDFTDIADGFMNINSVDELSAAQSGIEKR